MRQIETKKFPGMCITINAIESSMDIPEYMTAEEIRIATLDDDYRGMLSELQFCCWPLAIVRVQKTYSHPGHSEIKSQSWMAMQ